MPYPFSGSDVAVPFQNLLNDTVDAANAKVQSGGGTLSVTTAGTPRSATVTFPVAYTTAPTVVVSARTSAPHQLFATHSAATTTGFTVWVCNTVNTSSVSYTWIATP